jgi:hypothetical protein
VIRDSQFWCIFNPAVQFKQRDIRKYYFCIVGDKKKSRDSSVGIALGYGLDDRSSEFRFPAGDEIFLFITASRTALGPTQPPIQWVPGALFLGVKRPGREAGHSSPSSAEVKECVELYFHSPIRLHGVVHGLEKAHGQLYLFTLW